MKFIVEKAKKIHESTLLTGQMITKYIQFDQIETFEHDGGLGIDLSIKPKTDQILSAKVCRISIRALTLSKDKITE